MALFLNLLLSAAAVSAFESDIISDIVTSAADESRALKMKSEQFWKPMQDAAVEAADLKKTFFAVDDIEAAIANLDDEHQAVRKMLSEGLMHLRHAEDAVAVQAQQTSEVSEEESAAGVWSESSPFSFLTGGQNYFSLAVRRFIGGGHYSERLGHQIQRRQASVLPALRGAQSSTGNVLKDSRLASKLGFDALKYDVYNRKVPKTPKAAVDAANRLVEAAGNVRHRFTNLLTSTVDSVARDSREKHHDAAATVTTALFPSLEQPSETDKIMISF